MKKKLNLLLALLMAFSVISCGSDDDDNDDTPQQAEETTGSDGTTGSSGTSGTTGSTRSCLTSRQRENIRTFLIRVSDLRTFNSSGTELTRAEDGTETVENVTAVIDYQQSAENTWIVNANICSVAVPANCHQRQTVITFRNGCLNVNGSRARIINASDSSLIYSYFDARSVRDRASLASGRLMFTETERRNGVLVYRLNVQED